MTCPAPHFINIEVAVLAWGARQGVRHPSRFSQAASWTFQCSGPPLMRLLHEIIQIFAVVYGVGNCAKTISSIALIGNLSGLNATGLLHI